jgi:predicted TIM-barrel fold metal-dependent hydrolase
MPLDFGAHIYPDETLPEPVANTPLHSHPDLSHSINSPDKLKESYEEAGIDAAVLSQPYYMGNDDLENTRKANDSLLELVEENESFYGLASIPVGAGAEQAAQEFERALGEGFNGGALETKSDGVELTDPKVQPVLEVANEHGAPLLVHPKLHQSLHPEVLSDEYLLNAIFGREAALSESICKVIHQGILDKFTNLNLIYHHLGGNIASMIGRVHLQLDRGRWPNQNNVKEFAKFEEQLTDRIYLDSSGFFGYETPVQEAINTFSSSNILFGTDYPYEPRNADELSQFVRTIENVGSTKEAEDILSANAMKLLVNI